MYRFRLILGCFTAIALGSTLMLTEQLPLEPVKESGQSITGALEGWYQNPDGTYSILVGYFNRNSKETHDIPVGPNNRIEPGGPDRGQPTHFLPRRQWGVFTIIVPKDFGDRRLTWTITANGQTTTIPMHLHPLWVVTPYKDAAIGNTPPTIKFDPAGKTFTGPPQGIASTLTGKVGEPLSLTAWVDDDRVRPPESAAAGRGRGGNAPPANLSWSKFRGPGAVTFSSARPQAEADGKATTTATFSMPGEYILRGQVNDSTGDGGGGFQCCWTNVHVKVTVGAASSVPQK